MALISMLHLWAYPLKLYTRSSVEPDSNGALFDALNIWDMLKAIGRAGKWVLVGRKERHRDESHELVDKHTDGEIAEHRPGLGDTDQPSSDQLNVNAFPAESRLHTEEEDIQSKHLHLHRSELDLPTSVYDFTYPHASRHS
ncbi:hypothetical protein H2200_008598 [Cladophialophora chaetospira]|uniref:Uncharacterized protein n=1 Tax=Cladophialophora chaetospira TaxID=386627 RepID=A0AA38X4P6_9EURO|nr:hypothetical protein H2200_008598 [Cladophialophora chaetospira]